MNRQEFEEIIQEINTAKVPSLYHVEDECTLFVDAKPVELAIGLDLDKHRWYECSTTVYKVGEWFMGVNGASDMKSEASSWEDLCVKTQAFEMKEIQSVTYVRKK